MFICRVTLNFQCHQQHYNECCLYILSHTKLAVLTPCKMQNDRVFGCFFVCCISFLSFLRSISCHVFYLLHLPNYFLYFSIHNRISSVASFKPSLHISLYSHLTFAPRHVQNIDIVYNRDTFLNTWTRYGFPSVDPIECLLLLML